MKSREPSKFELQLSQLKTELKDAQASENKARIKELSKFIRNLEAVIKRIEGLPK